MTQNRTTRHDSTAEATVRLNKAFTAFLNAEFEGLDRRNATQRSTTQQHSLTPHTTPLFACPVHSRSDLQHGWVGQEFAVQHEANTSDVRDLRSAPVAPRRFLVLATVSQAAAGSQPCTPSRTAHPISKHQKPENSRRKSVERKSGQMRMSCL